MAAASDGKPMGRSVTDNKIYVGVMTEIGGETYRLVNPSGISRVWFSITGVGAMYLPVRSNQVGVKAAIT